ncbi:hypothetical protein DXG01_011951 [Tephrocybe rancida]|nr:hypothetical protein DXG01_011951 [Tephrocybe rancida]
MEVTSVQRGTKRKRYEPPPQDLSVKISGKLHHSLKEVKKAAKKAKAFETQKFIKKLKDLRKKSESSGEMGETEQQLELLKELDHELVATTALKTKLNKSRILRENEDVQAAISKELVTEITPATQGTGVAKVQSRLLSSKILAVEVATAVTNLRHVIQPLAPSLEPAGENEQIPERPQKAEAKIVKEKTLPTKAAVISPASVEDVEGEEELDEDAEIDDEGWESGTVEEDGTEGQGGWESGSINGGSSEDSEDDEELAVLPPKKMKKAPAPIRATAKPAGMRSTFLPSLSVGFTRGESDDSDLSETEIKVADIDIKKNRRGQRARRAIWEKKFGKDANHKKKEAETIGPGRFGHGSKPSSNTQHPPNHRSTVPNRRPAVVKSMPQYRQEADTGWGQRTAAPAHSSTLRPTATVRNLAKPRVEEKSMHPSWEAKRRLKEKESAGIVPSQGKKTKF